MTEHKLETDHTEEIRNTIQQLFESRKYSEALEHIYALLRELPDDWEGQLWLSKCLLIEECYEEAEEVAEQMLTQDPEDADALFVLSQIYVNQKLWSQAIDYLEQTIAASPEWDVPHHRLALTLYRSENMALAAQGYFKQSFEKGYLQRTKRAEAELIKAMELSPGKAEYHAHYGLLLDRMLQHEAAERHLQEAIILEPMNAEVHSAYAEFYYAQGKMKELREHINQALMLEPEHHIANNLAIKLEEYEKQPIKVLKPLIRIQELRARLSENPSYYYWRAVVLKLELGGSNPRKELQAYLRLVPDDQNAQLLYGKALYDSRRYLKAEHFFKSLKQQNGDNAYIEQWMQTCSNVNPIKKYVLFPAILAVGSIFRYVLLPIVKLVFIYPIYVYLRYKTKQKGATEQ